MAAIVLGRSGHLLTWQSIAPDFNASGRRLAGTRVMPPECWMSWPPRCKHRCGFSTAVERLRSRPGRHGGRALHEIARPWRHARFTPNRHRRRPGRGCTGNSHAATHGKRPECFSPATGPENSNDRNHSDGAPGTAWAAQTRRRRLSIPRATQATKGRTRAASMPPSAPLRAQAPSPEAMPRGSIGNAEPHRQTFKNETRSQ